MVNWTCTLYKDAVAAQTAINAIANTVTLHVVSVDDPVLGLCIMVIKSA